MMEKGKIVALVAVLFLTIATASTIAAQPPTGYFEEGSITFESKGNRALGVVMNKTYYNSDRRGIQLTVTETIPSSAVENIRIWDGSGNLPFQTSVGDEKTTLTFQTRNIPPRSSYSYYISYDVKEAVAGSAYEYRVLAWGFTAETEYKRYIVTVKGPPGTYPFLSRENATLISKDPPTWQYVTALKKGEKAESFQSRFYASPALYKITTTIPIYGPASGSAAGVLLDAIVLSGEIASQFSAVIASNYQPVGAYFDPDNNLHIIFSLGNISAGERREVQIELLCEVSVHDPGISAENVRSFSEISRSLENYTVPAEGWESDSPFISQAARDLVAGEPNVYAALEKIHRYVVERLSYELQDVRRGALWAFINRRGDCSEYTDLSIALARAVGIPARAIYGWGLSGKDNIVEHAWPEFYLPGVGWQPSDPTWAESAGDYFCRIETVHIAKSIRGLTAGEAASRLTFYGEAPEFGKSATTVSIIELSEVRQLYITAAEYLLRIAENLFKVENEILARKLELARGELQAGRMAQDDTESILHTKNSMFYSGEIVRALGRPPTEEGWELSYWLPVFLIAVGCLTAVAAGTLKLKRGRQNNFYERYQNFCIIDFAGIFIQRLKFEARKA